MKISPQSVNTRLRIVCYATRPELRLYIVCSAVAHLWHNLPDRSSLLTGNRTTPKLNIVATCFFLKTGACMLPQNICAAFSTFLLYVLIFYVSRKVKYIRASKTYARKKKIYSARKINTFAQFIICVV